MSNQQKNPTLAAILSFLWPGLGQIYNGQVGKGFGFMAIQFLINVPLSFIVIGIFTGLGFTVYMVYDAYKTAERLNAENPPSALRVCLGCGRMIPESNAYCPHCGKPLAAQGNSGASA